MLAAQPVSHVPCVPGRMPGFSLSNVTSKARTDGPVEELNQQTDVAGSGNKAQNVTSWVLQRSDRLASGNAEVQEAEWEPG